jgi:hypothetical protein
VAEEDGVTWGIRRKRKDASEQKYSNKKVEHAGHWFDSKLEAALYDLLVLRERAGEIRDLSHQPGTVFLSAARIQYRPDFRFTNCASGEVEYAESKGYPDAKWPLKKKMWRFYGPGKLEIWMGSYRSPKLVETIIPKESA